MSRREVFALGSYLSPELKGRTISDARYTVSLTDSLQQACLVGRADELANSLRQVAAILLPSGQTGDC